jgi:hypothetical protein
MIVITCDKYYSPFFQKIKQVGVQVILISKKEYFEPNIFSIYNAIFKFSDFIELKIKKEKNLYKSEKFEYKKDNFKKREFEKKKNNFKRKNNQNFKKDLKLKKKIWDKNNYLVKKVKINYENEENEENEENIKEKNNNILKINYEKINENETNNEDIEEIEDLDEELDEDDINEDENLTQEEENEKKKTESELKIEKNEKKFFSEISKEKNSVMKVYPKKTEEILLTDKEI